MKPSFSTVSKIAFAAWEVDAKKRSAGVCSVAMAVHSLPKGVSRFKAGVTFLRRK
jgi:hypothetical protein